MTPVSVGRCVCVCALTRGIVAMVAEGSGVRYLRIFKVSDQLNFLTFSLSVCLVFSLSLSFYNNNNNLII